MPIELVTSLIELKLSDYSYKADRIFLALIMEQQEFLEVSRFRYVQM